MHSVRHGTYVCTVRDCKQLFSVLTDNSYSTAAGGNSAGSFKFREPPPAMEVYWVASFASLLMIMCNFNETLSLCSVNPSTKGIQVLKQRKAEARVNRITNLLSEGNELSSANRKELTNLLRSDTYDPAGFSESHGLFKLSQNKVFSALGMHVLNNIPAVGTSAIDHFSWHFLIIISSFKDVFHWHQGETSSLPLMNSSNLDDDTELHEMFSFMRSIVCKIFVSLRCLRKFFTGQW